MSVMEIVKLALSVVGGGGVIALVWQWKAARTAEYRALDDYYRALLAQYLANADYANESVIANLRDDRNYHCFAMNVHAFAETLFDVHGKKIANHAQWGRIFSYHVKLHGAWLARNVKLHEREYINYVLDSRVLDTKEALALDEASQLDAPGPPEQRLRMRAAA